MYSIKKEKLRPMNGPGNNGLRGKKGYINPRIAVGPWLDTWGGHPYFQRGFTSTGFETETEHSQKHGIDRNPLIYGAGLHDHHIMDDRTSTKDSFHMDTSSTDMWLSTTKAMADIDWKEKVEEKITTKVYGNQDITHQYRLKYTNDDVNFRTNRFLTENRHAYHYHYPTSNNTNNRNNSTGNANYLYDDSFFVGSPKLLSGIPKSIENLHMKLLEKYGILTASVLRFVCWQGGKALISSAMLKQYLKQLNITISQIDFNQMVAYLTADDTINIETLQVNLISRVHGFDEKLPRMHFMKYFQNTPIPISSMISILCNSDDSFNSTKNNKQYPEVCSGLSEYIACYSNDENMIDLADFIQLYRDLFSSDRKHYKQFVDSLWC